MIFAANDNNKGEIVTYQEPFDMRLAMRKVEFGEFGIQGSRQFVYPSFVRLGKEAISLIHKASETDANQEKYSTMSSPKRYLWDGKRSKEEWQFITLEGEKDKHILNIPGISEQLQSNGCLATMGTGGQSYHYSRRSMMTFAFLEMLSQAEMQINSDKYRIDRGDKNMPRRIDVSLSLAPQPCPNWNVKLWLNAPPMQLNYSTSSMAAQKTEWTLFRQCLQ